MRLRGKAAYTPARLPVLRWLTAGGADVKPDIRDLLLSELFGSQSAVVLAVLNGLFFNSVALYLAGGHIFAEFMAIDVVLAVCRVWVVRRAAAASAIGKPTPTDIYLLAAMFWCALQGAMIFAAMRTGNVALQVLGGCTAMGLVGPICARSYPAPRYAMVLIFLSDFPFLVGALMTGNPAMAALILQAPLHAFGCLAVIRRLRAMAVALLEAEFVSQQRAERDTLTGLLNREGLADALRGLEAAGTTFVLFYLDLDGFKAVNDTMGHPAGDALLQAVAALLQTSTRETDTVARLGGDEFVVVTPNLSAAESAALASSIVGRIADQEYDLGAKGLARIGVSVGYACWPEDGPTLKLLQEHADSALYAAKKAGKGVHWRFAGTHILAETTEAK